MLFHSRASILLTPPLTPSLRALTPLQPECFLCTRGQVATKWCLAYADLTRDLTPSLRRGGGGKTGLRAPAKQQQQQQQQEQQKRQHQQQRRQQQQQQPAAAARAAGAARAAAAAAELDAILM